MNRIVSACLCAVIAMAVAAPAVADRGYKGHRGYREHPSDRHRHYNRYDYGGRQYVYQGHWRSWHEWDDYYRRQPWMHDHGHYYHEEGHLMFRFCDPASHACFFFSIGM